MIQTASLPDIPAIRVLAEKIWPQTYASILTSGQIAYMMDQIYSPASLLRQMQELGHIFLILDHQGEPAGFASYSIYPGNNIAKLQKIYVDPSFQGKGLGLALLNEVILRVKKAGCLRLRLNVNRHNKARSFYEKQGFFIAGEEDIDIGGGFFMNDYVMELRVDS